MAFTSHTLPTRIAFLVAWLAALVALPLILTGCCCDCSNAIEQAIELSEASNAEMEEDEDEEEESEPRKATKKRSKKASKGAKSSKKKKKAKKSDSNDDGSLASVSQSSITRVLKAEGWKLAVDPTVSENPSAKTVTFTIMKMPITGAVALYDYKQASMAKMAAPSIAQHSALHQDGSRLLFVTIPQDKAMAEKLLKKLMEP
ncbi:MAG: hypothetical protein AAFX99_06075 [Myxococcota bacterium]